jgi:hypothetical protein
MASIIYTSLFRDLAKADIDFDTATIKAMLTTSAYTENKDHDRRDDVTNEITATGYTAGGVTVTATVAAVDTANDRFVLTLGPATWSNFTGTSRKLVYYVSLGGASSADPIIAIVDFGSDVTRTAQTMEVAGSTITWQN